jgi:hypothetical protein
VILTEGRAQPELIQSAVDDLLHALYTTLAAWLRCGRGLETQRVDQRRVLAALVLQRQLLDVW